ncbi:Hypothetical predicted protein [Octopus vulgaris]|uniref:Ima1 N-terminal domain-containing protein n=3 Tax=Octopus vulgaris TaxID=6645 RepID=A0AA36FJH1_OCTVU|nr:Hypothetical predicted protein [Octopus vulgaris]
MAMSTMEYFLYLQIVAAFLAVFALFGCTVLIFKLIRAKFPVRVVCWFCSEKSTVPFGNCNCWDCPHCEQYNGFKKDGDYNKPIPAQWSSELNFPISCSKEKMVPLSNGLCSACNERQLLKVQQLAVFKPFVEANYNKEVNDYKEHLEKIYNLCYKCKLYVQQELEKLDMFLKMKYPQTLSGSALSPASSVSTVSTSTLSQSSKLSCVQAQLPSLLQMFSFVSAIILLIAYIFQISLNFFTTMMLPIWSVHLCQLLTRNVCPIAISGLFFCLASKFLFLGRVRLYAGDVVDALFWLLLNVVGLMFLHDRPASPLALGLHCLCHTVNTVSTCLCLVWTRVNYQSREELDYSDSFASQTSLDDSSCSSPKPGSTRSYHTTNSSASSYKSFSTSPMLRCKPLSSSTHPLHRSKSSASLINFPVRKSSWSPLSVQTNFPSFSSGSQTDIPSFGSLSKASDGAGFNRCLSPSPNLFSSYSSPIKRCFSSNGSLNQFNSSNLSSPSPLSHYQSLSDDQHNSISDKILGLKMDSINLGRSFNTSKSSMGSFNRWPRSPSSVLSRGDIAPARLLYDRKNVSPSGTYLDKNSLSSSKFSSSNQFNDTASVFSDSFSIKPSDSKSCHEFGSDDQFEKSDRQNDFQSSMKKSNTDSCLVDSTTDNTTRSTAPTTSKAMFLAFSIAVNVVLILIVLLRDFPLSLYFSRAATQASYYTKHVTHQLVQFFTDHT